MWRHAYEFPWRAVKVVREPDERLLHRGVSDIRRGAIGPHVPEELALADEIDPVLRCPVTFLIGDVERAVVIDANPIGGTETIGNNRGLRAVLADPKQRAVLGHEGRLRMTGGLGIVEIACGVGLQTHRELMEMLGDLVVAVEALVEATYINGAPDNVTVLVADVIEDDLHSVQLLGAAT